MNIYPNIEGMIKSITENIDNYDDRNDCRQELRLEILKRGSCCDEIAYKFLQSRFKRIRQKQMSRGLTGDGRPGYYGNRYENGNYPIVENYGLDPEVLYDYDLSDETEYLENNDR